MTAEHIQYLALMIGGMLVMVVIASIWLVPGDDEIL